jgi:lipopolysaccharide/colanic/teichoic acid biosynthesis glycosyltransferase
MYKLRTMRVTKAGSGPVITAKDDGRIFPVGAWLRRAKIDELPQLLNILRGDMSIIGPRPEDPAIVSKYYSPSDLDVLRVKPGLASPGTLYSYTTLDDLIVSDDPERLYVERVLPAKLALDRQYVDRASLSYDLALIGRTVGILAAKLAGKRAFADPPELMNRPLASRPH